MRTLEQRRQDLAVHISKMDIGDAINLNTHLATIVDYPLGYLIQHVADLMKQNGFYCSGEKVNDEHFKLTRVFSDDVSYEEAIKVFKQKLI
jgi:hypothetical protein